MIFRENTYGHESDAHSDSAWQNFFSAVTHTIAICLYLRYVYVSHWLVDLKNNIKHQNVSPIRLDKSSSAEKKECCPWLSVTLCAWVAAGNEWGHDRQEEWLNTMPCPLAVWMELQWTGLHLLSSSPSSVSSVVKCCAPFQIPCHLILAHICGLHTTVPDMFPKQ